MNKKLPAAITVLALALIPSLTHAAGQENTEATFKRVAAMDGEARDVGTRFLERQADNEPQVIMPTLREMAKSPTASERDLAELLLLWTERRDDVLAWRTAATVTSRRTIHTRPEGGLVVRWNAEAEEQARALGLWPLPDEVVIDTDAAPVMRALLREGRRGNALPLMDNSLTPECVPALIEAMGPGQDDDVIRLLARVAKHAAPTLRAVLTDFAALPKVADHDRPAQFVRRRVEQRAAGVAQALALAGADAVDAETATALLHALEHAENHSRLAAAAVALEIPGTAPLLFSKAADIIHFMKHRQPYGSYHSLRIHFIKLGETGREYLLERSLQQIDLPESAMVAGWMYELDHPHEAEAHYFSWSATYHQPWARRGASDPVASGQYAFWSGKATPPGITVPTPLLMERAVVRSTDLIELAHRPDATLAFDILATALPDTDAIRGLGELGDPRAIAVFRNKPDLTSNDDRRIALFTALLTLDTPEAADLLEEILETARQSTDGSAIITASLAEKLLPAARGDREALATLLAHETPALRRVAARILTRHADPRGIQALMELALETRGSEHRSLRQLLIDAGEPAQDALEARWSTTDEWRERLFCEATLLRIREPELANAFQTALLRPNPIPMKKIPPTPQEILARAVSIARKSGRAALPLFEAALAFNSDAAHVPLALVAFKEDRSLDLIIRLLPEIDASQRSSFVFALTEFGEKGVEAASNIPAADPAQRGFHSRRGAHRAATQTLAHAGDEQTLENVLEGLATLPPPTHGDDLDQKTFLEWNRRTATYLQLASSFQDPRLLEIGVSLIENSHAHLYSPALNLIAEYDDPRIIPLSIGLIARPLRSAKLIDLDVTALKVLAEKTGNRVMDLLVPEYHRAEEPETKQGLILAITHQGLHTSPTARDQVREFLIAALADGHPAVQMEAADALATVSTAKNKPGTIDRKATQPLIDWTRQQRSVPYSVIQYITHSGHPDAGEILLDLYRHSERKPTQIASALGTLGHAPALPDILQTVEQKIAARRYDFGLLELGALANFGATGRGHIRRLAITEDTPIEARILAALALADVDKGRAHDVVSMVFHASIRTGQEISSYQFADLATSVVHTGGTPTAHRIFTSALMETDNASLQSALAHRIRLLETRDPSLRNN